MKVTKWNKKGKWIFWGIAFTISSTILISSYFVINKLKSSKPNEKEFINVTINGAVYYPGEYSLKKGSIVNDLLKLAKLKANADLSKISKTNTLLDSQKFYIPFNKQKKFFISEINDVEILINLGINKKLALKIFNLIKEKGSKITWKDFESIKGLGPKTLEILKKSIIFET
ncbi:Uncharacterised protein [Metamycoplasma arthritidis]|uniref:Soluble ligand binding domain-containing protein n=1 Tax=Metamycoplasma arthritidis (strain 158L3-1) TaxID=243272 RepID=B3PMI8_META1|nr:hypothetical protein [Metamycoplasma arthritidis]ACF07240.1 hypothetical protein MARTH_orf371 [Metamycoplasma arthritidis 158L3-1]VEU78764.1 Uncharacterised protein [Metamycoplasma arthritidis]